MPQTIAVSNGTVSVSESGEISFSPDENYNGDDVSFAYVISDGTATASADVAITVTAVNDGPEAVADEYTVEEDGTVVLDLLANDTDLDGDAGDLVGEVAE